MSRNLVLHVGWSKTGTSAFQRTLAENREMLCKVGVLYPSTGQLFDYAHHEFALSFDPFAYLQAGRPSELVLADLKYEILNTAARTVIISTELSPFYFDQPAFNAFVDEWFSSITVAFTIRRQSELLLSLFNQLIKDVSIRFKGNLLGLLAENIERFNFFENVTKWSANHRVKKIIIVPYSNRVVQDLYNSLDIDWDFRNLQYSHDFTNVSFPTRLLPALQEAGREISDPDRFLAIRNWMVENEDRFVGVERTLYSAHDQFAIDEYYMRSNGNLEKLYFGGRNMFPVKSYRDVNALCATCYSDIAKLGGHI